MKKAISQKTYLLKGIPLALHQELRIRAIKDNTTIREVILDAIQAYLKNHEVTKGCGVLK